MKLTFLGGAQTVTGSKFLLAAKQTRILIDCGLFQGVKLLRRRNWKPLPLDPSQVDAVVLTHAHIDHSGYLPVFARSGFTGPAYCTPPTKDLAAILLPDSGYLQEEDARYANKKKFSKHAPALPLYTEKEAERVANALRPVPFEQELQVGALTVRFRPGGHILGAATVEVSDGKRSVLFSGDLGRYDDLLMYPPTDPQSPTYVVMESTYGDRSHPEVAPIDALGEAVARAVARGGVVLIPSFAVGRAQLVLYCLHRLFERDAIPRVPVYVNSPMATDVTKLYQVHFDQHRLSESECAVVCGGARFVGSVEESKWLNNEKGPMVIISASGMVSGGRILHHVKQFGPDERNMIVLPGFQAPGTRGEALVSGAKAVKIHGAYVPIEAEVVHLDVFSAHADCEDLTRWLGSCARPPRGVFLVHGEPAASDKLRRRIEEKLRYPVDVAEHGETVELA